MAAEQLKLTIELVPSTAGYSNLYAFYKSMNETYKQGKIKKSLLEKEGWRGLAYSRKW